MTTDDLLPPLSALRDRPAPPVTAVRDRLRSRRRARAAAAGLATGAALLLAVGVASRPGQRDRGFGAVGKVRLDAVVEGPAGARPLDGRPVGPDERLVFAVRSDRPVAVVLHEVAAGGDTVVWPAAGTWWVEGAAWVGGEAPQAWRPDGAVGEARYLVVACPDAAALATGRGCARDEVVVRFAP